MTYTIKHLLIVLLCDPDYTLINGPHHLNTYFVSANNIQTKKIIQFYYIHLDQWNCLFHNKLNYVDDFMSIETTKCAWSAYFAFGNFLRDLRSV